MAEINPVLVALAARPREIEIVCARDGHSYQQKDDGGAVTRDGFVPHPFRQQAMRKARAKDKLTKEPLFYVRTKLAPLFPNDPLADFPVLDEAAKELVAKNVKAKKDRELRDRDQLVTEAKKMGANEFISKIVSEIVNQTAEAERKAKAEKAAADKAPEKK